MPRKGMKWPNITPPPCRFAAYPYIYQTWERSMAHDDLPLFSWRPPAQLLPFPAEAQIGEARMMVQELMNRKSEKTRQKFWDGYVYQLRERLSGIGVETAAIDREVDAFRVLVEQESNRLYCEGQPLSQRPDGAA